MKTRVITSILIVLVAIPTFLLSGYIVYPIVLALLAGISVFELLRVQGCGKSPAIAIPSYLIALALPIAAFFAGGHIMQFFLICAIIIYAFLLYMLVLSVFSKGKLPFSKASGVFCSVSYAVLAFAALGVIRYIENGAFCFITVFIASWVSDVFALLVGTLIGKHKLIPEISPKKTVEGFIGGVVFATVAMLLYGLIVDMAVDNVTVNYIILGAMGLGLSLLSQVGDLIASTIKREGGIKDYGDILPGHGGITDRFDSIFAVAIPALVICVLFPPFT